MVENNVGGNSNHLKCKIFGSNPQKPSTSIQFKWKKLKIRNRIPKNCAQMEQEFRIILNFFYHFD